MSENNQIQPGGVEFATGQVLTPGRLNDVIGKASLRKGAISEQPELLVAEAADELIVSKPDNTSLKPQKTTVLSVLSTGAPLVSSNVSSDEIVSTTKVSVSHGEDEEGEPERIVSVSGNVEIAGGIKSLSDVDLGADVVVLGNKAVKVPSGTTQQRPEPTADGQVYYNTSSKRLEFSKAGQWVSTSSAIYAEGGQKLIAPSTTVVTATYEAAPAREFYPNRTYAPALANLNQAFLSYNKRSANELVVYKVNHGISVGQVVEFFDTGPDASGFVKPSGEHVCSRVLSPDSFVIKMHAGLPSEFPYYTTIPNITTPRACTFRRSGNYRCHIFDEPGTWTLQFQGRGGCVEVLVVGGGSALGGPGNWSYWNRYKVSDNQPVTVVVGAGGQGVYNASTNEWAGTKNGQSSSFDSLVAHGGDNGLDQWNQTNLASALITNPDLQTPNDFILHSTITGYSRYFCGMNQNGGYSAWQPDSNWLETAGLVKGTQILNEGVCFQGVDGTGSAGGYNVKNHLGAYGEYEPPTGTTAKGGSGTVIIRYPYYL